MIRMNEGEKKGNLLQSTKLVSKKFVCIEKFIMRASKLEFMNL